MNNLHWVTKTFEELTKTELYEILQTRAEVFVKGQGINCVDPDGVDYKSLHFFSMAEGKVNSYLRAYGADAGAVKVGRILAVPQKEGIGTGLMQYAIKELKKRTGCERIIMDAQKHAVPFYEKLGFKVTSGEYLEEGIVHVDMCLQMKDESDSIDR